MKSAFADTSYYIALLNEKDESHSKAVQATSHVKGDVFTTAWVLTELADALCDQESRIRVFRFISELRENVRVKIIPPGPKIYEAGLDLDGQRPDKDWSLTDCISFVVMQEEGLTDALTADHHFEQAGFVVLLK